MKKPALKELLALQEPKFQRGILAEIKRMEKERSDEQQLENKTTKVYYYIGVSLLALVCVLIFIIVIAVIKEIT